MEKKKTKTGLVVGIIAALLIIIILILMNNPNAMPGVKLEVNAPKPVVITSRYDDNNSTLLKEKGTVYASVQNQGGQGKVLVTFYVYQAGNTYQRIKSVYFNSSETQDINVTFDEVTRLGGEIKYNVEVRAE